MSNFILADEYVTDTMAIVLHLEHRKSSAKVKEIFALADAGTVVIHVPSLVFAEILYLSEKSRISLTLLEVKNHLAKYPNYRETVQCYEIIEHAAQINDIPELHDRLIAATAKYLNLELVTNDPKIQNSAFVKTVW